MVSGKKTDNYEELFFQRLKELSRKAGSLRRLDLHGLGMNWGGYARDQYRDELSPFFHVEEIDLSSNYIDMMDIDLGRFPRLKKLNLSDNALWYWGTYGQLDLAKELPAPALEHLDLSGCQIGCVRLLGTAFKASLQSLDLSGAVFHHAREDGRTRPILRLDAFPRLRSLRLSQNDLEHVPKLGFLPALEHLDLSINPIRSGHEELLRLPRLKDLDLGATRLRRVPSSLLQMRHLRRLDVQNNDLEEQAKTALRRALPDTEVLC